MSPGSRSSQRRSLTMPRPGVELGTRLPRPTGANKIIMGSYQGMLRMCPDSIFGRKDDEGIFHFSESAGNICVCFSVLLIFFWLFRKFCKSATIVSRFLDSTVDVFWACQTVYLQFMPLFATENTSYRVFGVRYYPKQKEYKIEDLILESNVEVAVLWGTASLMRPSRDAKSEDPVKCVFVLGLKVFLPGQFPVRFPVLIHAHVPSRTLFCGEIHVGHLVLPGHFDITAPHEEATAMGHDGGHDGRPFQRRCHLLR